MSHNMGINSIQCYIANSVVINLCIHTVNNMSRSRYTVVLGNIVSLVYRVSMVSGVMIT